jgi:SET domain-containing protein
VIRRSRIAGKGAFATRRIRKGQRIIEYVGERISEEESDRRYPDDAAHAVHHTFLFAVDDNTVIDASRGGNQARFINHSCQPNCEAIDEDGRIFIFAMKNIQPGNELTYDYQYARSEDDEPHEESIYPCYCGAPRCRGTILEPRKRRKSKTPGRGKGRRT